MIQRESKEQKKKVNHASAGKIAPRMGAKMPLSMPCMMPMESERAPETRIPFGYIRMVNPHMPAEATMPSNMYKNTIIHG